MYWIALLPSHEDERTAWGWRALQFTPRVAEVDEALLVEASASLRLWGGRNGLLARLLQETEPLAPVQWAQARTALSALGLLRLQLRGESPAGASAARSSARCADRGTGACSHPGAHRLPQLGRSARPCRGRGWRGASARRLLEALDAAYGERPERYPWLQLPEEFDLKVELAALATTAPELMWAAQRLLTQLQVWLQARHRGVLALELEWTLDLRRLNGVRLPSHEQLTVRTAQPTQDIAHLRRLVAEHLSRATLSAPANHLRLRSLETMPWGGASKSLLPEDNVKGERLHQLVERLSVRLGEGNVVVPQARADHRPERMQRWVPARTVMPDASAHAQARNDMPAMPSIRPGCCRSPCAWKCRARNRSITGRCASWPAPSGWRPAGGTTVRKAWRCVTTSLPAAMRPGCCGCTASGSATADAVRWYLQGIYA